MPDYLSKANWKTQEIVALVILSMSLGILWCGLSYLTAFLKPFSIFGLNHLLAGFWFMGGTLVPFFIRRPGAAFAGELLAAGVEVFQWGITMLAWGFMQGLGAELIFFIFRYKRYDRLTFVLAGMLAGMFAWSLNFLYYQYWTLASWLWLLKMVLILLSGAFLGGWLSYYLGKKLVDTGVTSSLLSENS